MINWNYNTKHRKSPYAKRAVLPQIRVIELHHKAKANQKAFRITKPALEFLDYNSITRKIKIGVDTENKTIVIIPNDNNNDKNGRRISFSNKNRPSGTISITDLINDLNLPTGDIYTVHQSEDGRSIYFNYD